MTWSSKPQKNASATAPDTAAADLANIHDGAAAADNRQCAAADAADFALAVSDDAAALVGAEIGSVVAAAADARTRLVESCVAATGCHNSPAPHGN